MKGNRVDVERGTRKERGLYASYKMTTTRMDYNATATRHGTTWCVNRCREKYTERWRRSKVWYSFALRAERVKKNLGEGRRQEQNEEIRFKLNNIREENRGIQKDKYITRTSGRKLIQDKHNEEGMKSCRKELEAIQIRNKELRKNKTEEADRK